MALAHVEQAGASHAKPSGDSTSNSATLSGPASDGKAVARTINILCAD